MIICRYCSSKIWDYAQICPHCGEVLKKEEKNPIEATTINSSAEPDFKLYLGGGAETVFLHQGMRKKFYLIVKKLSSFPISGAEVQLSGPSHVELIIKSRKIRVKKQINRIDFIISPKELGFFTLTATLTSETGYRIVFPIKIRVEPIDFTYYYEETLTEPAPIPLSPVGYYRLAILIIGLIMIMIYLSAFG